MDTKRCSYCHKLARAEAETCSRCGHPYVKITNGVTKVNTVPMKSSNPASRGNRRNETVHLSMSDGNTGIQRRSIPPASPHRAGHYSGLHPEDQPYQSSFMPILRPSAITRRLVEQESDEALQPIVVSSAPSQLVHESEREPTPKRYVASPISSPSPMPQRYSGTLSQKAIPIPLPEVEPPPSVPESTLHEQITAP